MNLSFKYRMSQKMKSLYTWFLLALPLWLAGCVEPVELKMPDNEKLMTISGLITTDPGPYYIYINMSSPYGGNLSIIDNSVKNATVTIQDELGNIEVLSQYQFGIYRTRAGASGIRGRVGGTYTLTVNLQDGRTYASKAEVMPAVPALASVKSAYVEKTVIENDNELPDDRFELTAQFQDAAGERNFYRWDWTGVYEVATQPWEYTETDIRTGRLVSKPKSCCTTCWVKDTVSAIRVSDDRLFNGNFVQSQQVATIPVTPQTLNIRYRVEIRQYSLSETAYDYWRVMEMQTAKTGSVLDPPPANAKSNLYNVNDPEEMVIGYFGASAVSRQVVNLNRSDVPNPPPLLDYDDDCRVILNSTTIRPSFW
ncbi:DUF4249 family protein [Nibribacter ruber]|uniref:DUF4249 family protein n=1 Tax=Nibribacter ruber TaxID=2698458 RepID=A0A6P1P1K0_9BACT|nr:DUF4249 domain-containing protein [Nibribacter ruber]QHL87372.1 DUF4249 family protein [Nibribacter ruber]